MQRLAALEGFPDPRRPASGPHGFRAKISDYIEDPPIWESEPTAAMHLFRYRSR
jgi:hypothetical protein